MCDKPGGFVATDWGLSSLGDERLMIAELGMSHIVVRLVGGVRAQTMVRSGS